jgi:hypothetical protein
MNTLAMDQMLRGGRACVFDAYGTLFGIFGISRHACQVEAGALNVTHRPTELGTTACSDLDGAGISLLREHEVMVFERSIFPKTSSNGET